MGLLQRRGKRLSALARASHLRESSTGIQRGAAFHRGHEKVELGTVGGAGQRDPDGMEQRPALLRGLLFHAIGDAAKRLPVTITCRTSGCASSARIVASRSDASGEKSHN